MRSEASRCCGSHVNLLRLQEILDLLRLRIEEDPRLPIHTLYRQEFPAGSGRSPVLHPIETVPVAIGAYLLVDRIVLMVRFDERELADEVMDLVGPTIRAALRARVGKWFPELGEDEYELQLWDTTGGFVEVERL